MSAELVDAMHELLSEANANWPREAFTTAEGHVGVLETRMARATGSRKVLFCLSSVTDKREEGVTQFVATIFAEDLVISGRLTTSNEKISPRKIDADVAMVPRTAIRRLTLHQVDYFDNERAGPGGYVSFTADYDGMDPIVVGPPSSYVRGDAISDLFDALQEDLAKA